MANNQKFTLTFDAQLNVNQMKSALSQIQSTLNGLHLPQNIARSLQGTFDKLSNEIQNFEVAIGKDITSKADFKKIENQADKIGEAFRRLKIQVSSLTGLSGKELEKLFPISITQNIKKASSAIEQYSKKVTDATGDVNKQQQAVDALNKKINSISNRQVYTKSEWKKLGEDIKAAEEELSNFKALRDQAKGIKEEREEALPSTYKKSSTWSRAKKELQEYEQQIKRVEALLSELYQKKDAGITGEKQVSELNKNKTALAEAEEQLKKYKQALDLLKNSSEDDGGLKKLLDEIGKLTGLDMSKFTADVDGAGEAIKTYLDQETQKASKNVDKLTTSIKNAEQPIKNTGEAVREYGERVDYAYQKTREVDALKQRITYFFGLNNTIQLVKRTMKSAISTIKELDAAMTATAVVTDFTVADMWEQLPEYTKRANELGVSTKAAYEAATLYYQQGLKTNEVMAISNETLKMARIAGLDAATATDRVTNAIRGFNMAINEVNAQRINDVYSRLAAISASNVDEISTAMTKVASLANSANMEFETTAAFLAQIVETTRESAETAGTALKTVIARFSEVKKLYSENELRGTDEEGLEIDVNKISTALRTAGIDLNKYFLGEVGLDDIFMELASKWDKLTSVQQRYIATQAAGSRQQSRFIALMSNYARTQELVGEAYNANGAAVKQFAKTQESLESKLARLKNAWNEFAMGILNSDLVKIGVDILTNLLNFVNQLTTAFGNLEGGIGGVISSIAKLGVLVGGLSLGKGLLNSLLGEKLEKAGGILSLFSKGKGGEDSSVSLISKLGSGIVKILSKQLSVPDMSGLGSKIWGGIKGGASSIWGGLQSLGAKTTSATGSIMTGLAGLGALAAIPAIVLSINRISTTLHKVSLEGQVEAAENYAAALSKIADNAKSAAKEVESVQADYTKYSEAIDEAQTSGARAKAIKDRNEYITSLLEQNKEYQKYLSTTFEGGQIKLVLDKDAIANAVEKAAEVAQRMGAYSDLSSAVAEQTKVNLYKDKLKGVDFEKGQRTVTTTDEYGTVTFIYDLSEEEKTKYQTYQNLLNQTTSQMEILAKQGISQLMTKDLLSDEVIDSASSFLAKNFVGSDYTEQLFNYKQAVEDLKLDPGELKDYYKQVLGVEPDDELKDKDLIAAIAQKQMFDANTQELINNLETLITDNRYKEPFENILAATSGKGKINEINIAEYINENGELNEATLDKFYDKLGFSVLNTDQLSGITGAYIANAKEQIKQQAISINNIQKVNKSNIFRNLLQSGTEVTRNLQEFVKNLNPEQAKAISDITTKAKDLLSEDKYSNLLGSLESGLGSSENLTEIQDFFNNFNLDNPINAFLQLKEAEKQAQDSGDELFESLANDVRESNSIILSTSNLLKTFIQSSEYDELTESVHEFIEENGRLTPKKIEELAKESKTLKTLIDDVGISVNGLAKALTAIDRGAPLEGLTQAVLNSFSAVEDFDTALQEMYDTIDNFDPGRSYGEGTEFITKQLETLQELIDKRSFGGEQFKNIYALLFGEEAYNEFFRDWGTKGIEEYVEAAQEQLDKLNNYVNYNSFGFMTDMAEKSQLGISFKEGSRESFNWEIGTATTEDLVKEIQQLGYSKQVAQMLLLGYAEQSYDFSQQLKENDYTAALKKFVNDFKNARIVTEQELSLFAKAFNKDIDEVKSDLYNNEFNLSKIVNWDSLSSEEIVNKIQNISNDIQEVFKDSVKKTFNGESYFDYDSIINTLKESFNLSQEQAEEIIEPLSKKLHMAIGKEIKTSNFNPGTGELEIKYSFVKVGKNEGVDELKQKIEDVYKKADYNILVDALVNADWGRVGEAIVDGITKKLNAADWLVIETAPSVSSHSSASHHSSSSRGSVNVRQSEASGDSFLTTPGWALTGEEGPEIVWNKEKGYSYITGQSGPEFRTLQYGDRIFNAQDTSRILKHSSFAKGGIFRSYSKQTPEITTGSYNQNWPSSSGSGGGSARQPTKWRNELDWLYNLMEDIAELERSQTKLQEQHDRYLEDISKTGRDLYEISNEQLNNLRTQLDNQREALARRRQEMAEQLQASGYTNYVWWNDKDKTIEIDWDAIEAIQDKDTYDAVSDLVSKVEKIQDEMDTAEDALWDIEGTIKEIENRYLEEYTNFQKRIYDAVVNSYQEQIDRLSQLNDTLNDSNNAILNSLQHEIELQRQIRDNTDTENNIRDMEARLAYLRRDTTGANESEIRALEKQLEEARQNYADTLIDQSIDRLQESNDKAAEQREKQISLLTAQLDYWKETGALWPEVATLLETGLSEDGALIGGSALEQILRDAEDWKAMSEQQREVWANELITSANQAGAYLLKISEGFDNLSAGIWALIPQSSLTTEKYQYATGGLASYTGPAWLDGTPQEPEYVLNARQTDAFLRLAEVLPSMFGNQGTTVNNLGHDIYVEFNMNVNKITSDYDVDRIVDRVKEDIYNISSYRNVNSISFSR